MASARANPFWVGAFVVGAAALGALAVILFGSGRLFEQADRRVSYFDDSVTGLDVGAPVIFRGVQVGSVTEIDAIIDPESFDVAVPVYYDLVRGRVQVTGEGLGGDEGLRAFVDAGLRAQLKTQSLITGKLYLDLDLHADTAADLKRLDPTVVEIPTVPTELQQLQREARAIFAKLGSLPLEDIVLRVAGAAESLDALLRKPELAKAIEGLDVTLVEVRQLLRRVDQRLDGLGEGTEVLLGELNAAVGDARKILGSADDALQPQSPLRYQLMATLKELEGAAQSLRLLSDELGRQPEQLLFGRSKQGGEE